LADIHIHREHTLGLDTAREIAMKWAEDVEKDFDMSCTITEGDFSDTVEFKRSGVQGQLIVAADHFELNAKLGFLLGAFAKTIEREIQANLEKQLAAAQPVARKTAKAAKKTAGSAAASKRKA
jgi:putative polyhydroxyalkanoate system protein